MTRSPALPSLLLLFAACAGAPEIREEPAVEEAAEAKRQQAADTKRRDIQAVLVRLDQAMDSYVQNVANQGEPRADAQAERLYKLIQDMVLDRGLARAGAPLPSHGRTLDALLAEAMDTNDPQAQGIALAALGFSGQHDVMPTILQGAQSKDPFVVDRAVLGLAVLRAPRTPPGVLETIVLDPAHPEDGRVQAAWALFRLQGVTEDTSPYVAIWQRLLGERRADLPAGVLVQALRGIGLVRDVANAPLAAALLKHPVALVRMSAAIALGRMNAQAYWQDLLKLLEPSETAQNVRLFARKALVELAGGVDHKYDLQAWRKTFDRGPR
jgi:HEAT repeat protein